MERLYSEKVPVPPKLHNYKKLHSSIIKTKLETLMLAMKYVYTGNSQGKLQNCRALFKQPFYEDSEMRKHWIKIHINK